ncbi:NAD(P)H-dependent oxidoreductase [Clostridium algidicarnis]|uniref:flavodoxin family protein n=1 Tax=Clostridium algidicarnis TaxID=37659 RepID=UPI001C0C89D0|nr:NAD(P)H-dependent oxidoreductase [Clostridium algidicarnis]MBU3210529.1 NAD(P)H-dependent oxidoreductase [Clostridium algidicarnis]
MEVIVVYGTEHKGSTYNIVQLFLEELLVTKENITEFFLPKDMPNFCCGCTSCFGKGEEFCPHYEKVQPIKMAMEKADLIILASPVYVWHVTGQMKVLLDHFGFQFMVHRPNKAMFSKTALVITTAAGGGMKSAIKDMTMSLTHWGVGKIFTYGKAVAASDWQGVNNKKKKQIKQDVNKLSVKIKKRYKYITPSFKVKALFFVMRFIQMRFHFNPTDKKYWEQQGWLGKQRPW